MPFLEKGKRAQDKTVKKYRPDFTKFFKSQTDRILLRLNSEYNFKSPNDLIPENEIDTLIEVIFPMPFENDQLKNTARPLHTSGMIKQMEISNEILGSSVLASISNMEVQAALLRLGNLITRVNDATREMLRETISTGIKNGDNVLTIADNIRDTGLNEWYEGRALAIAQTESRYAADAGGRAVYRELGVEKFDVLGCVGTLAAPNALGLSSSYGDFSESNGSCGVLEVDMELWDQVSGLHHPRHQGVQAPSEMPKK
ncbi:hypothetical protein [Polynucleobacter sp.]|uniref:hypothetical protein n=1 Tax=Polynucleobacter sp. TaxID=2029855 RepID=UPI003F69F0BA